MPAADDVEGVEVRFGAAPVFLDRLGGASSFGCLQMGLAACRWTFACLTVPLRGVLRTGLRGLATRAIGNRKNLRGVIVLLVSVLGVDILKRLHHSRTKDRFLDHVHRRLMGRNLYLSDSAPSV